MQFLSVLYLILIIVGTSAQGALKKAYNTRGGVAVFTFSAVSVITACLFFLIKSGFGLNFELEVLPYALGFAASYSVAVVFSFLAIRTGPLSLTSLATSYSLLIPTAYGLIFDKDEAGVFLYVGILLLAISIFLIASKSGGGKVTVKWALFALLALVGNGMCSTVQTVQTVTFEGKYDSSFMVIALSAVAVVLVILALTTERDDVKRSLKIGYPFMICCGIANGLVNLFVMLASGLVNKSVMFPLISAGGIVLTWLISAFLYKEKLSKKQNIGMVLGVLSIIFLNL